MTRTLAHAAIAALITLFIVTAETSRAAEPAPGTVPHSVMDLFNRLPDLPASAAEAASWVDPRGQLLHGPLRALADDIAAHQRAVAVIARSLDAQGRAQNTAQLESLSAGMAEVGIDMPRMQRDPAYAQQVQERLRRMSPAEMIAMSQKMSQPMATDARIGNEARAMAEDAAAVRAAAEAGFVYSSAQVERLQAHDAIWREAEAAVARLQAKPLQVAARKPSIEWDNPGCDAACRGQWDLHAGQMLPLMVARETEALQLRRAALHRQRQAVLAGLKAADRHLQASRYGAASRSQANRVRIVGYDAAAIAELQQLTARITDSVRRAAAVTHCGRQLVLVPLAVCS